MVLFVTNNGHKFLDSTLRKSFAKRRCNFEGWGEFDTSECTFKDGSNASVVILHGKISSSLIQDIEAFRNMVCYECY